MTKITTNDATACITIEAEPTIKLKDFCELLQPLRKLYPKHKVILSKPSPCEAINFVKYQTTEDIMKQITMKTIVETCAKDYNITTAEIKSPQRNSQFIEPRHIAMYLCNQLTYKSLPQIGDFFDRDHTTVIHAIKKVEASPELTEAAQRLKRHLLK